MRRKGKEKTCRGLCVKLLRILSFPEALLSLTPSPDAQGACLEMVAWSSFCEDEVVYTPLAKRAHRDRGRQLKAGALFTAEWGRKQADVNEGWRFHEAQLVDGRFNVTGLNWAMIRTVCKIHFLACLCPPAPSSKRSSPSPSSYACECSKNWTRNCCVQFLLTTITFKKERKKKRVMDFFFVTSKKLFFPPCKVSILSATQQRNEVCAGMCGCLHMTRE